MSVAIFSEVLPLFRWFVPWCNITVSGDIFPRNSFTWCVTAFVETPGIDLTQTVDFILLFKQQPSTCFKMESPTIRVFFLGTFMGLEFFKGSLCGVVLNFLLLSLFTMKIVISSLWNWRLTFIIFGKSIVHLCASSTRVLHGSLVFDKLCVDEVDGRYCFTVITFIIWVIFIIVFIILMIWVKFPFLRYLSSV